MTDSYRERIVKTVVERFAGIVAGAPAGDPYTIQWSTVLRRPAKELERGKANVLSVLATRENKDYLTQQMESTMEVVLEWAAMLQGTMDPDTFNNTILMEVQRKAVDMATWTETGTGEQLILAVYERGNELNVDSYTPANAKVEGTLFLTVIYRHYQLDPRRYI